MDVSSQPALVQPVPLVQWVGGRADLFAALPAATARFDPRRRSAAPFLDRVRTLDRVAWAEPLARVRPSWVFYDCALVPGALFGYAYDSADGLVPVSLLALIPTLDGADLVQSLAALDLAGITADELAVRTLIEGTRALGTRRVRAAIPWSSPFLRRFLALGPLRLETAWTPAHDEPRTVTFSVATRAIGCAVPVATGDAPASGHALGGDDATLQALQAELEGGARAYIRAWTDGGPIVARAPAAAGDA